MTSIATCAVVGGGPAGLFGAYIAAVTAQELGVAVEVKLYERNQDPGKKLLLTGASQCNITRNASVAHMLEHYGAHGRFLRSALYELSPERTMTLFNSLGLNLTVRDDDKVFPASFRASDVRDTLVEACRRHKVIIQNNTRIRKITYEHGIFTLKSDHHADIQADSVILCTGGVSYPKTGSTGDGHQMLASLGHTITDLRSGLCGVRVLDSTIGKCSGITLDRVSLSFTDSSGKRHHSHGPLLFTHTGLSGPVILNAVRYMPDHGTISICLLPRDSGKPSQVQEIESRLRSLCASHGSAQLNTVLHRLGLPMKLIQWILHQCTVDGTEKAAQISTSMYRMLATALVDQQFVISLSGSRDQAMVTAGGASLAQFDPKTMESRLIPRLFCAGELLDIDGDTGGYNLQAAWSTGAIAGMHAVRCFTRDS